MLVIRDAQLAVFRAQRINDIARRIERDLEDGQIPWRTSFSVTRAAVEKAMMFYAIRDYRDIRAYVELVGYLGVDFDSDRGRQDVIRAGMAAGVGLRRVIVAVMMERSRGR